jgi:hypothetical protein
MRVETLRIGWMTCVRAVTAENPELVWCCDTVTLLLGSPHVEVGDRRSEISMGKDRDDGKKSRKEIEGLPCVA